MTDLFDNRRILVTGACGTVGSELVRQLMEEYRVGELIGVDNNESELFLLDQKFSNYTRASFFLADVRDQYKMIRMMEDIDIVFHTAAFKHVMLCEQSPMEAIQTNVMGVQNLITAAIESRVGKVIFTSSDKAVNPTNVMGTSKLMGERLMTAANVSNRNNRPIFSSTRFGNVLGSRGSVIPIFREQIRNGGPLTVTDKAMTRFIMSIKEAVRLVIDSASLAKGGEIFVTKMPTIRIQDLAEVMIHELAPRYGFNPEQIKINYIGTKPGEKMYEELMNFEEIRRAIELDKYFVIKPAFTKYNQNGFYDYSNIVSDKVTNPYHSGDEIPLTKEQLLRFLNENNLIEESVDKALTSKGEVLAELELKRRQYAEVRGQKSEI